MQPIFYICHINNYKYNMQKAKPKYQQQPISYRQFSLTKKYKHILSNNINQNNYNHASLQHDIDYNNEAVKFIRTYYDRNKNRKYNKQCNTDSINCYIDLDGQMLSEQQDIQTQRNINTVRSHLRKYQKQNRPFISIQTTAVAQKQSIINTDSLQKYVDPTDKSKYFISKFKQKQKQKEKQEYKARSIKCISQRLFNATNSYNQIQQEPNQQYNRFNTTAQTPFVYLKMNRIRNRISKKIKSLIKLQINEQNHKNYNHHHIHNENQISNSFIQIVQPIKINYFNQTINEFSRSGGSNMLEKNSNLRGVKKRNYKSSYSPSRAQFKCKHGLNNQHVKINLKSQCMDCQKQKKIMENINKKDYIRPWSGVFLAQGQNF